MLLTIVQAGDPVLREEARDLSREEILDPSTQRLIEQMRETMRAAPGVGLAAPQIGQSIGLLVIEDSAERMAALTPEERAARKRVPVPFHVLINPRLTILDDTAVEFFEGCLSVRSEGTPFLSLVPRASEVRVEALNEKADPVQIKASGWYARILQHEIDHLHGVLCIDRMVPRTLSTKLNVEQYWRKKSAAEVRSLLAGDPAAARMAELPVEEMLVLNEIIESSRAAASHPDVEKMAQLRAEEIRVTRETIQNERSRLDALLQANDDALSTEAPIPIQDDSLPPFSALRALIHEMVELDTAACHHLDLDVAKDGNATDPTLDAARTDWHNLQGRRAPKGDWESWTGIPTMADLHGLSSLEAAQRLARSVSEAYEAHHPPDLAAPSPNPDVLGRELAIDLCRLLCLLRLGLASPTPEEADDVRVVLRREEATIQEKWEDVFRWVPGSRLWRLAESNRALDAAHRVSAEARCEIDALLREAALERARQGEEPSAPQRNQEEALHRLNRASQELFRQTLDLKLFLGHPLLGPQTELSLDFLSGHPDFLETLEGLQGAARSAADAWEELVRLRSRSAEG